MNKKSYVWYVAYGSNMSRQRFLCYIEGGTPEYGKKSNKGCRDATYPVEDKPLKIPYRLYFALPDNRSETPNWGLGGVAFIHPHKESNEKNWTLCRMWKITREQYLDIREQEGLIWYNHELLLGEENYNPIYTITNKKYLNNILPPSESYIKTILVGLKEIYQLSEIEIAEYFVQKEGIKGNLMKKE